MTAIFICHFTFFLQISQTSKGKSKGKKVYSIGGPTNGFWMVLVHSFFQEVCLIEIPNPTVFQPETLNCRTARPRAPNCPPSNFEWPSRRPVNLGPFKSWSGPMTRGPSYVRVQCLEQIMQFMQHVYVNRALSV